MTRWNQVALSGQIPFFSTYLFHILQAVAVVFLAGGRMAMGRKADTMDVLYARQAGNGDFVWGKVWGTLKVCGGVMAAVMAVVVFLHVVVAKSPFSLWAYFFYALTLALPSLVFVLGLSLWVNCVVKGRALSLLLLLGGMGMLYSYLKEVGYGVLDVFGQTAPMVGSDVTGMADMGAYLLQRGMFLVAGIGLVFLTVAAFPRLPNRPGTAGVRLAGWGCLVLAVVMGSAYVWHFRAAEKRTAEYGAIYDRYADAGQVHVAEQALEVKLDGSRLQGKSRMTVVNAGTEEMEKVVLYLNPGLRVESLTCGQEAVPFAREGQAVIVERALQAGDTLRLEMEYGGKIDEAVCYTDVPLKNRREQPKWQGVFCFGKRYAWVEKGFAQLTPECLWYPTGTAAAHPASPFDIRKDFTQYSLTVVHPEGMTVISQGEATREAGVTRFSNRTPLPGISLTAGEYERMGTEVDSVLYEVYYFRGHDFFSEPLAILRDTMESFIRDDCYSIREGWAKNYPFKRFAFVETPAPYSTYLRNQKRYTEFVMPELVFLPEKGFSLHNTDIPALMEIRNQSTSSEIQDSIEIAMNLLRDLLYEIFNVWEDAEKRAVIRSMEPMFVQHVLFIQSDKYPIIDIILQKSQATGSVQFSSQTDDIEHNLRAKLYLQKHSLRDAIADPNIDIHTLHALIQLKNDELEQLIRLRVSNEPYWEFTMNFFRKHAFEVVPFSTYCNGLREIGCTDIDSLLEKWYNTRGTPSVIIREIEPRLIKGQETEMCLLGFKAYNISEYDALLSVNANSKKGWTSPQYILSAGEAKEYKFVLDGKPISLNINTNISHNMPSEYNFRYYTQSQFPTTRDTTAGVFPIGTKAFSPAPGEIIVDNEDTGFTITNGKQKHKLKALFREESKDKYNPFVSFFAPIEWTAFIQNWCYGEVVKSALYKKNGTGQACATWTAELPEGGYYEIAIWNAKDSFMRMYLGLPNGGEKRMERIQHYLVRYGEKEETIDIDLEVEENGWVSLGHFDLPAGEVSITLTDETTGEYVIADAVKFTRIE